MKEKRFWIKYQLFIKIGIRKYHIVYFKDKTCLNFFEELGYKP